MTHLPLSAAVVVGYLDPSTLAMMIPIVTMVMALTIPIVAIVTKTKKQREIYALHHRERLAAIEKGIELPPLPESLLSDEIARPYHPSRYLLKGLVWLFIGLALMLSLGSFNWEGSRGSWLFGSLPTGVGLAYLIYYFAAARHEPPPPGGKPAA